MVWQKNLSNHLAKVLRITSKQSSCNNKFLRRARNLSEQLVLTRILFWKLRNLLWFKKSIEFMQWYLQNGNANRLRIYGIKCHLNLMKNEDLKLKNLLCSIIFLEKNIYNLKKPNLNILGAPILRKKLDSAQLPRQSYHKKTK